LSTALPTQSTGTSTRESGGEPRRQSVCRKPHLGLARFLGGLAKPGQGRTPALLSSGGEGLALCVHHHVSLLARGERPRWCAAAAADPLEAREACNEAWAPTMRVRAMTARHALKLGGLKVGKDCGFLVGAQRAEPGGGHRFQG